MELTELIARSVKHNASDLHLCNGEFPRWRRENRLGIIPDTPKLTLDWFNAFIEQQLTPLLQQQLQEQGHCDFAFSSEQGIRLRASLFTQRQGLSLSLRFLYPHIIDMERLQLPKAINRLITREHGLLLVAGATGSGKTTTLTSLIDFLNQSYDRHLIMLEDPIEFFHTNHCCLIQQRELGEHIPDFAIGITAALRQDPDIIVVGELRDKKTLQIALTAAETGHLVLATLHGTDTTQALQRLIDAFPKDEQETARHQLAQALTAVLAQQLFYQAERIRVVYELLINSQAVASLIREGRLHQLVGQIEQSNQEGMVSFRQSLEGLTKNDPPTIAEVMNRDFQTSFLK